MNEKIPLAKTKCKEYSLLRETEGDLKRLRIK